MEKASKFFSLDSLFTLSVVEVKNLKTGNVINRPDISSGQRPSIEVVSLEEHGIVLGLPRYSCTEGNAIAVTLEIYSQGTDGAERFEAEGVVVNHSEVGGKLMLVEIEFKKFHSNRWQDLLQSHQQRQKELMRLLRAVRD